MECSRYAEWIAHKLEGTLPPGQQNELEKHLSVCRRCRAELLLQRMIIQSLQEEIPSGLPAGFTQRVSHRALEMAKARRRSQRWAILIPAVAPAVAIILLVLVRVQLARELPTAMNTFAHTVASPLAWMGGRFVELLARPVGLAADKTVFMEAVLRPLMTNLAAVIIACAAVFWAFSRVLTFIRE